MKTRINPLLRQPLMMTLLSSATIPIARADYAAEVLSENPIAYYRFDDGVATDDLPSPAVNLGSAGATVNGAYGGNFIRGVGGALVGSGDTAVQGAGTLVTIPNDASLNNSGSFSAEVWLKPATIPASGALISPIASFRENDGTYGRAGWLIYQGDAATGFNFRTYNRNGSSTAVSINSGAGITAGAWHHVVVTWDQTTAVGKVYVNGVLKNTSAPVTPGGPNTATYEPNNTRPFTLGSRDGAFAWSGDIDEAAYYTSVLSDAQVLAHYNNGISGSPSPSYDTLVQSDSPAGYWRLGEAAFVPRTPPVADNAGSLGAGADGAYYAGSKNASTGPSPASGFQGFSAGNSCLSLANADGHVGTGLSLLSNRSAFTVMGWVKRGAVKSTRGGYFGQNDLLEFGDAGSGASIEAWVNARGGNIVSPYSFADDEWGFIVLTGDSANSTLYLNGAQVGQISGNLASYGSSAFNFNIGGGGIFNAAGDYFRGEIDEVAVFDKAVTPGRVQQLYDSALGTVGPGLVDALPLVDPVEGEVPEGQPFTLSIDVTGSPPFTYEWFRDGVAVPNSNTSTLTVAAAEPNTPISDPYEYTVTVTNSSGSVTSDPAEVFVIPVLKWTGTDATNPGIWAISGNTLNWKSFTTGTPQAFNDDYAVLFDDSGTATTATLTEEVNPVGIVFDNSAKDYLVTGNHILGVFNKVVKNGSGLVEVGVEDFSAYDILVNEGTMKLAETMTFGLLPDCIVAVEGGTFDIGLATDTPYPNETTVASGATVMISGSGDFDLTDGGPGIVGAGSQIFDRNGIVTVSQPNSLAGGVSILSGTVVFDGNQVRNRLANGSLVEVAPGAAMEIHGVNGLPTAADSASVMLEQSLLTVVSGGSDVIGPGGQSHAHLGNVIMDEGTVTLAYSGEGSAYSSESFQLNGGITVTGTAPSSIVMDSSASAATSGIALSGNATHPFAVAAGADLIIAAELENSDASAENAALAVIAKTGGGTLQLPGDLPHGFTGSLQVNEGTLAATGSIAGPLTVASGATLEVGSPIGTFTAGSTTLNGTFRCDIDGAASDQLAADGDLVFGSGATIALSIGGGGATEPFYEIASCSGTISGDLPTLTGTVPPGYTLQIVSGSSLVLSQGSLSNGLGFMAVPPSGTETFDSSGGGFTVSTPVSPETDWTYGGGTWLSFGTDTGTGVGTNTTYLTTPVYTVGAAGPVTISFDHVYNFEVDYDAGAIEVNVDGSGFIRVPGSAFTSNGYDGTLVAGTNSALAGQEGFLNVSVSNPGFHTTTATLLANAPAGTTVQVRFMAAYDDAFSAGGWEIDSFAITNALPSLFQLDWTLGTVQYSDTLLPDSWIDLSNTSPLLIDTTAAAMRFFRLKP